MIAIRTAKPGLDAAALPMANIATTAREHPFRRLPVQSCAMRRRCKFLGAILVVAVCVRIAVAEPVSSLQPRDCVNDFAGVLSPSTMTQLKQMCRQVLDKTQASVVVVTVRSTDGEDIFNYSVDLYQKWGIGQKGKDRGVLILLAVQDRKYYINVGYGLEPILPDGKVGGFGREAVPYLKQRDYDSAVTLLTSRIVAVIAQDAGVEITTSQPRRIPPVDQPPEMHLSTGTIIGLIVLVIIVLAVPPLRRLLFYMLLFGGGSRGGGYSGGGWGGGGFGGSGGGFGGFGGGSTGGGGAGGSW